jgi:hypothetical protein
MLPQIYVELLIGMVRSIVGWHWPRPSQRPPPVTASGPRLVWRTQRAASASPERPKQGMRSKERPGYGLEDGIG